MLATGAVLVGCASSGTPASTAMSAAGGSQGAVIPVGVIGSYSGTEAPYLQGADKVLEAWADWVNAAGGI